MLFVPLFCCHISFIWLVYFSFQPQFCSDTDCQKYCPVISGLLPDELHTWAIPHFRERQFIKWQVASFNLWSNFTASDLLSRLLKLRQTFLICSVSKYWQNVCWIFIPFNAAKLGKQSSIFTTEWVINFIKEPLWVLISVWKRVKGWNLYPLKESNYWCLWWWPISIVNLLQMCN